MYYDDYYKLIHNILKELKIEFDTDFVRDDPRCPHGDDLEIKF